MGNVGGQASLGRKGMSTFLFDPVKLKGVTITLSNRDGRRGAVVGDMGLKERCITRRTRRSREVTAMTAAATAALLPAASKGWMGDGMEHHGSPLTVARLHLHSPGMICSSVASLDYLISWGGGGLCFVLFWCFPVVHADTWCWFSSDCLCCGQNDDLGF